MGFLSTLWIFRMRRWLYSGSAAKRERAATGLTTSSLAPAGIAIVQILGTEGESPVVIQSIVSALNNPDAQLWNLDNAINEVSPDTAKICANTLARHKELGFNVLLKLVEITSNPGPNHRCCIRALGTFRDIRSVDAFPRNLTFYPELTAEYAEALGMIAHPQAAERLAHALAFNKREPLARTLLSALRLQGEHALPYLCDMVGTGEPDNQEFEKSVANALTELGPQQAILPLFKRLVEMPTNSSTDLSRGIHGPLGQTLVALLLKPDGTCSPIAEYLRSEKLASEAYRQDRACVLAAHLFASCQESDAKTSLAAVLRSKLEDMFVLSNSRQESLHKDLAIEYALALAKLGDPRGLSLLVRNAETDKAVDIYPSQKESIGTWIDKKARDQLVEALRGTIRKIPAEELTRIAEMQDRTCLARIQEPGASTGDRDNGVNYVVSETKKFPIEFSRVRAMAHDELKRRKGNKGSSS